MSVNISYTYFISTYCPAIIDIKQVEKTADAAQSMVWSGSPWTVTKYITQVQFWGTCTIHISIFCLFIFDYYICLITWDISYFAVYRLFYQQPEKKIKIPIITKMLTIGSNNSSNHNRSTPSTHHIHVNICIMYVYL